MLSLSANLTSALYRPNSEPVFLLIIYGDTATFYFADRELTITDGANTYQFKAVVKDWGNIRNTIDLFSKGSSVANVKIKFVNAPFHKDATRYWDVSDFVSTTSIVNRSAEIYFGVRGLTELSDFVKVFSGVVELPDNVATDELEIGLIDGTFLKHKDIPLIQLDESNFPAVPPREYKKRVPLVYGTFALDDDLRGNLHPCVWIDNNKIVVAGQIISSFEALWMFDEELNQLCKIDNSCYSVDLDDNGMTVITFTVDVLILEAYIYPESNEIVAQDDDWPDYPFLNWESAANHPVSGAETFDKDSNTSLSIYSPSANLSGTYVLTGSVKWKMPNITVERAVITGVTDGYCYRTGIYESSCSHHATVTVSEGNYFPNCPVDDQPTTWTIQTALTHPTAVYLEVSYEMLYGMTVSPTLIWGNNFETMVLNFGNNPNPGEYAISAGNNQTWEHISESEITLAVTQNLGPSWPYTGRRHIEIRDLRLRVVYNRPFPLSKERAAWPVYGECHGQEYGAWISEGGRTNSYSAGDVIDNPAHIIEAILRDQLGISGTEIDVTSFDIAAAELESWPLAISITKYENSRRTIERICQQSKLNFFWNSQGKATLKIIDIGTPTEDDSLDISDISKNNGLKLSMGNLNFLVNCFTLYYQFWPLFNDYRSKLLTENATSQDTYNGIFDKEMSADSIPTGAIATLLSDHFAGTSGFWKDLRPIITVEMSDLRKMKWEVGDIIKPNSTLDNIIRLFNTGWGSAGFIISEKTLSPGKLQFKMMKIN